MPQSTAGGEVTDNGGVHISTSGTSEILPAGQESASPVVEGQRPAWLPEGFNTEAEFQAAYDAPRGANGELVKPEAKPAAAAAEGDKDKPAATEEKVEGVRSDDEIKASLKAAGGIYADPRYEAGALEFEKTGDVTDATKAALATAFGVDRSAVDAFIEGQKAQRTLLTTTADHAANQVRSEFHAVVGSEAAYGEFMKWAGENLSDAEKVAYNDALDKTPGAAKVMLEGFNAKYKAAGNGAPRDLTTEGGGNGSTSSAATGYASSAEMQRDMNDPKYATDAAFRAQVAAKVQVSKY